MTAFERNIIGVAVSTAPLAMGVALFLAGYSQAHPQWWTAAVQLAVLGGITIMIYGVNVQALPAHSGKKWRYPQLVALQIGTGIAGAWMLAVGYGNRIEGWIQLGNLLALTGAVLFLANLMLLFTQPGERPPKIPWDQRTHQQKVDRLAIPFTMISGLMVVVGTGLGVALDYWKPAQGRWDLVWAHLMLLGFFFAMASGTSYHMLGRWAKREYTSLRLVQVHVVAFLIGLPTMTIALGWDVDWLFRIGAVSMAVAMICWAINILPVAWSLSPAVRVGIALALVFMVAGISLGVLFAADEALGPRLRTTHVVANLFGFAGLLISGFGYRYVPLLANVREMRWPKWNMPQIALMAAGCAFGMLFMGLRMYGHIEPEVVLWPCSIGAVGMAVFAANTAATFIAKSRHS